MRWLAGILAAVHSRPGLALAIYWPVIFIGTHLPRFGPLRGEPRHRFPLDKVAHFASYAVLAWLIMLLLRRTRPPGAIALTLVLVAVYGAIDELTQPFIGRTADIWDYAANLAGMAVGTLVASRWSLTPAREKPPRQQTE